MVSVTELRAGKTFKLNDKPYQVVDYKHTKLGRGKANIRVRVRDLRTGEVTEKSFVSGAKVEPIETETKPFQYLYHDEASCYFMETASFEQFSLPIKIFQDKLKFLQEGEKVRILFWEGEPLSFELPNSMIFRVAKTSPGVKGNTVSGATKPATLDNGLMVRVPLFVREGDRVKVDTRTGEYLGREK